MQSCDFNSRPANLAHACVFRIFFIVDSIHLNENICNDHYIYELTHIRTVNFTYPQKLKPMHEYYRKHRNVLDTTIN